MPSKNACGQDGWGCCVVYQRIELFIFRSAEGHTDIAPLILAKLERKVEEVLNNVDDRVVLIFLVDVAQYNEMVWSLPSHLRDMLNIRLGEPRGSG
jgi:hypothetical protein